MAQTIGFVVETDNEGRATVVVEKGQGCGSCRTAFQCHGGRAARAEKTPAFNPIGAAVGDRVSLTVASGALLSRMAVLYLVPVFGMLAGAFTGAFVNGGVDGANSGHSVVFGLAGFVLGFVVSVAVSRVWSAVRPIMPVITRIVNVRSVSAPAGPSAGCDRGAG
jgi:sigma-E factor negative regulatory protein RseC